ncbi:uncharacterized protein [Rutidosis leptorrhynchoides]|uniref:uncharacterized protein n=1 Tax=Rutidosis leptorrhynchoides TaxID=125765 RepID=UPI003A9A38C0
MDRDRQFTLRSIESDAVDVIKGRVVEIEEAISILTKSHGLTLCQVWITRAVKNENEECAVKLTGYYADAFKDYYDACVKIQDGSGELAVKALENYQAYFSRNINKGKLQALLPATTAESSCCLAICLRNFETGDFDYVFELFFSSYHIKNRYVFLESLFLKLESCLPSFKFSSGAQLGSQLLVTDVDNLTESFNILASKKQIEKADFEGRRLQRCINADLEKSLKLAAVEIRKALAILTESHGLTLCQVWVHHYVNNEGAKRAIKFDGYCSDAFKDYYRACVKIQNGAGGLALKTLVTYQPYFSRELQALLPATTAESCCCLAICLRNIYTGDLDYAFEFFFPLYYDKDPCVFLQSIFLKLKSCFPNFKLSSGAQLGRRLQVLDGDNREANFDFFAVITEDCNEDVKHLQFGTPNSTTDSNVATDVSLICVSDSMKFANLKKNISQRFRLVSNSYKLTYLVQTITGPSWAQLEDDGDLKTCICYCKRKSITQLLIRVLPEYLLVVPPPQK